VEQELVHGTVDGPLARDVADLRLALAAMSSQGDAQDLFWVPVPGVTASSVRPRVGVVRDCGIMAPDPVVGAALDAAAADLRDAGYLVTEIEIPMLAEAYRLWWSLCLAEYSGAAQVLEQAGDSDAVTVVRHYETVARHWWSGDLGVAEFVAGYARRSVLIQQVQQVLDRYPLLLLPVSAELPFEQDIDVDSAAGTERFMRANWSMMALANLALPALAVPSGVVDGLPVGVQVVGGRFTESAILDAGEVIERRAVGLTPIDPGGTPRRSRDRTPEPHW
jgi:amidase